MSPVQLFTLAVVTNKPKRTYKKSMIMSSIATYAPISPLFHYQSFGTNCNSLMVHLCHMHCKYKRFLSIILVLITLVLRTTMIIYGQSIANSDYMIKMMIMMMMLQLKMVVLILKTVMMILELLYFQLVLILVLVFPDLFFYQVISLSIVHMVILLSITIENACFSVSY